jgi:hypothetical protein
MSAPPADTPPPTNWLRHPAVAAARRYLRTVFTAPEVGVRRWYDEDDATQDAALRAWRDSQRGQLHAPPGRQGRAAVVDAIRAVIGRTTAAGLLAGTAVREPHTAATDVHDCADAAALACPQLGPEEITLYHERLRLLLALPPADRALVQALASGQTLAAIGAAMQPPVTAEAVFGQLRRIRRTLVQQDSHPTQRAQALATPLLVPHHQGPADEPLRPRQPRINRPMSWHAPDAPDAKQPGQPATPAAAPSPACQQPDTPVLYQQLMAEAAHAAAMAQQMRTFDAGPAAGAAQGPAQAAAPHGPLWWPGSRVG